MNKGNRELFYVRESAFQSIVSDIVSFGILFVAMYFNHRLLSGSTFIDFVFIALLVVTMLGRSSKRLKRFNTNEELIEYLKAEQSNAQD